MPAHRRIKRILPASPIAARLGDSYAFATMRKFAAVLLALIFAGSVGGDNSRSSHAFV